MLRNTAGQRWRVFAFTRSTSNPLTGGAANITAKISIDYGTRVSLADVDPEEAEDGYYYFDLTQAETNGHILEIFPESSTAGVQVLGAPVREITAVGQTILPVVAVERERQRSNVIPLFVGEQAYTIVFVKSYNGGAVDFTSKTLSLEIETQERVPVASISIAGSGTNFAFTPTAEVTSIARTLNWALWDVPGKAVICHGYIQVGYVPVL